MQQNPYQAPTYAEPYGAPGVHAAGHPQSWDIGEVIGLGWERVKEHWPVLIFSVVIAQVASNLPSWIVQLAGAEDNVAASLGASVLSMIIGSFFAVGYMRIYMKIARGQSAEIGELFTGGDRFGAMLVTNILTGLAVGLGMLLLIIPGIILLLGLYYAPWYCADTRMGPVDCMKASWEATNGQKMQLFGLALVSVLVIFLGALALLVGVFPAIAVIYMALCYAYLRASGRMGGADAGGFGGPGAPAGFGAPGGQPGGWGPQGGAQGGPPGGFGGPPGAPGGFGGPPQGGGFGGPPPGGGMPGGFGGPPQGGGSPGGWGGPPQGGGGPGGFGGPPQGGGGPGGFGGPPQGGGSPGGWGGPPQGGGGQPPPGWGQ